MKAIIQTPTPKLDTSVDFYTKLGFQVLSKKPSLLSDGQVVIEINPDRFARAGVKLYDHGWKETVARLEKLTTVVKTDQGYLFAEPSGTWIYLMEKNNPPDVELPESTSVLGNFAGLSLEVIAMQLALDIWELLGFSKSMGSVEQGWISLTSAEGMTVSLMKPLCCPHLFFNPSLTYFNGGKNLEVIEKIRQLNIPVTEEITHFNKEGIVDNVILRDPGGLGFFVFND